MKKLWKWLLRAAGWKVTITVPHVDKCIICVAPHTSNWDFILGLAAYGKYGWKANFLMKSFWFFWPLGLLIKALGGIPVFRKGNGKGSLTEQVICMFGSRPYVNLAVTPEGTRSLTDKWKTGFLYMAYGAGVPIELGVIDYARKQIMIENVYRPTGDAEADMKAIRSFYSQYSEAARYPEKFKA